MTDRPTADLGQPAALEALALAPLVDGHNGLAWEARDKSAHSISPVIFSHSSCRAVTDHPRKAPEIPGVLDVTA